eukprot:6471801-Alexandrium_andersonii.AAC.1
MAWPPSPSSWKMRSTSTEVSWKTVQAGATRRPAKMKHINIRMDLTTDAEGNAMWDMTRDVTDVTQHR